MVFSSHPISLKCQINGGSLINRGLEKLQNLINRGVKVNEGSEF